MNRSNLKDRILVVEGDITKQQVDAIVNAANTTLLEECRILQGCATGQAKITKGYCLPAKWVIHTVGPVWRDGQHGEDELLASCYRNSLTLAKNNGIRTLAFPSISTGAYGFPMDRAAKIAIQETSRFIASNSSIEQVLLVCFGRAAFEVYNQALAQSC